MSRAFIHDDFLLETDFASQLYHEFAAPQPIIDYHCHLPPEQVAADHRFSDMTELWLSGDHYKWRAMRAAGVNERYVTGDAPAWDKFQMWARTVPQTLRNPLYHWTHLELGFPFGLRDVLLDDTSARRVYEHCNEALSRPEFSARGLLRQYAVRVVCTTDDPVDSLEHHLAYAAQQAGAPVEPAALRLLPTFRPDRALGVDDPAAYAMWLEQLEAASGLSVASYAELLDALHARHEFFHQAGCRLSDHGLETFHAEHTTPAEAGQIFAAVRRGQKPTAEQSAKFKSALLYELGLMHHARGWVQQFHVGALRDTNRRLLARLGPNTGFDSIGDEPVARSLSRFLDRLDATDQLAKTILYNLNPRDNELYAAMTGNFQDGSVAGKIQYGSAWWLMDQKSGIERQLDALSNLGLLARFVGMLTDSRCFVSYSRHEYFRRVLCNLLGNDVAKGLLPRDLTLIGGLVSDVCHANAEAYFPFER